MSILTFSKKGDQGETSLFTGERVSKASLRPETYGTLDEAASALGLALSLTSSEKIRQMIATVQEDLRTLGGELACETGKEPVCQIDIDHTSRLERWIEELQEEAPLPRHFVYPGSNSAGAAIDLSRTIVRRAERRAAAMSEAGLMSNSLVLAYLNRLADFLFTLARCSEKVN